MSQIQCPNCGGDKVRTPQLNVGCMSYYFIGGVVITCWGLAVNGMASDVGVPNVYLWIGIAMLIGGVLYLIGQRNYARTHHECLVCGKTWETSK